MRRQILFFCILLSSIGSLASEVSQRKYDYYFLEAMVQRQKGNQAYGKLKHAQVGAFLAFPL